MPEFVRTADQARAPQDGATAVDAPKPRLTVKRVVEAVAARHGMTAAELIGRSRRVATAHARQEAMYCALVLTSAGFAGVGRVLGGRDHTTIIHGVAAHARRAGLPPWREADASALAQGFGEALDRPAPAVATRPDPLAARAAEEDRLRALVRSCIAEAAAEAEVPAHRIWGPDQSPAVKAARAAAVRLSQAMARVPQRRLAAAFGISRWSVRRALGGGEARA